MFSYANLLNLLLVIMLLAVTAAFLNHVDYRIDVELNQLVKKAMY